MAKDKRRKHDDGQVCLEGRPLVPKKFIPCCDAFAERVMACEYDGRYEWYPKAEIWVIACPDESGGGGIAIGFCPHCGEQLTSKLTEGRWMGVESMKVRGKARE
jgi:hypothetical protein